MISLREHMGQRLKHLDNVSERRSLQPPRGLDLSSNDYLGLASHPEFLAGIRRRLDEHGLDPESPVASPASRLLRGNTERHMALEARLAAWKGTEAALLFTSGFQANMGLLSTIIEKQDRVVSDTANHASLIDGLRLSRCFKMVVPHLDLDAIEQTLLAFKVVNDGRRFLITESLYSMNGDIAPLDAYAELAERYGAELIIDDSHASGVYGEARGSGLCEHFDVAHRTLAIVSTFGKALASSGGFVAGPRLLIDYLINHCRPFIFTTAAPPLHLYAVEAALDLIEAEPQRRQRVLELASRLRHRLQAGGIDCLGSCGPIVPVRVGRSKRAVALAAALQRLGFDVRAIRPPTVPLGGDLLRLSVHADHQTEDLDRLAQWLLTMLPNGSPAAISVDSTGWGGKTGEDPMRSP